MIIALECENEKSLNTGHFSKKSLQGYLFSFRVQCCLQFQTLREITQASGSGSAPGP